MSRTGNNWESCLPHYGKGGINSPRKAPNQVTEHRITFGNYERAFVTEIKTDIENAAKITAFSAVAVPVASVAALGVLGYGLYKGLNKVGDGLKEFSFGLPSIPGVDVFDRFFPTPDPNDSPSVSQSSQDLFSVALYAFSGGVFGMTPEAIRARREAQVNTGGDF